MNAISEKIADSLVDLFQHGFNFLTFEVVGFSLGAQFAGSVGRKVKSKSTGSFVLDRIVGLEPAKYSPVNLGTADGMFVMTVHTGDFASDPKAVGHAAFFVNGGNSQPMCQTTIGLVIYIDATCSHGQVQQYWIDAINSKSETFFPARKCISVNDFKYRTCDKTNDLGYMHPQTSNDLKGNYYLSTYISSPYSKADADP
jgi:hypothetical protein